MKSNINLAIIAYSLSLIGFATRIKNITSRDFWYDEAYTGILIRNNWHDFYYALLKDTHPPLYYGLLKLFYDGALHINPSIEPDFIIRLFSILFGTAIIPLSYHFLRTAKVKSRFLLFSVPLFLTLSPFFVAYSIEARAYSLTAFLTLLLVLSFIIGFNKSKYRLSHYWIFYAFTAALIIFTHYISFFALLSINLFYLYKFIKSNIKPVKDFDLRIIKYNFVKLIYFSYHLILIYLLAIISFCVWIPSFIIQAYHSGSTAWIPKSEFYYLPRSLYAFLFGVDTHALGVPYAFAIVPKFSVESIAFIGYTILLVVATISYRKFKKSEKDMFITVLFMSLVPIVFNILATALNINLYVERYFIGYAIFLIISILMVVSKLSVKYQYCVVAIYILLVMSVSNKYTFDANGYKDVTKLLSENSKIKLYFTDPFEYTIARYYANDNENRIYFTELDKKWAVNDWDIIKKTNIINAKNTRLSRYDILVTTADIKYLRQSSGNYNLNASAGFKYSKEIGMFKLYDNTFHFVAKPKPVSTTLKT